MHLPHHHITAPPPNTPLATMVIWVLALKNVAPVPRRRNRFRHCRHHHATPVLLATPPSTSVAFFVTLRFSNLVPYDAILKMFHVKKRHNCQSRRLNCRVAATSYSFWTHSKFSNQLLVVATGSLIWTSSCWNLTRFHYWRTESLRFHRWKNISNSVARVNALLPFAVI